MNSILKELYYGNIQPHEKAFRCSTEYDKFIKQLVSNEDVLKKYFNEHDELSDLVLSLDNMIKAQLIISDLTESERFIEGFKLGAKFAFEMFMVENSEYFMNII